MSETPMHKRPESCFVCGWPEADHKPDSVWAVKGHTFWSNADALAEARAADARTTVRYSTGATSPEAQYVETYRPY